MVACALWAVRASNFAETLMGRDKENRFVESVILAAMRQSGMKIARFYFKTGTPVQWHRTRFVSHSLDVAASYP